MPEDHLAFEMRVLRAISQKKINDREKWVKALLVKMVLVGAANELESWVETVPDQATRIQMENRITALRRQSLEVELV